MYFICVVLLVNAANICETEGEDQFPDLGDTILQPESIRSNFSDFDTSPFRRTLYIYSLHNNSRVEFFQNSSIDLQICFFLRNNNSEIQIIELLLQRNEGLYDILKSRTSNYSIQNDSCVDVMRMNRQICCISFPIDSDLIEDILKVSLYGIQIGSRGVRAITIRNADTEIKNCRVNGMSDSQDVIPQDSCIDDQPPLIQFLFQNSCIIYGMLIDFT